MVYPRVGGEPVHWVTPTGKKKGLSPRGRGTPSKPSFMASWSRSIPAWAGNPTIKFDHTAWGSVYPRVGGEPALPKEPLAIGWRSIPAWAGNPQFNRARDRREPVYPRVGGEPVQA